MEPIKKKNQKAKTIQKKYNEIYRTAVIRRVCQLSIKTQQQNTLCGLKVEPHHIQELSACEKYYFKLVGKYELHNTCCQTTGQPCRMKQ